MEVIHQNMISTVSSKTVLDEDFLTERESIGINMQTTQFN